MKPTAKAFVAGCSVLALIGIAGLVTVILIFSSRKEEIVAKAKAARGDGAERGKSVAEPQCVDEALSTYRRSPGIVSSVRTSLWLGGCLESASVDATFCTNIPSESEFTRTIGWRVAQCTARGLGGDSSCPNIFGQIQKYCAGTKRATKQAQEPR